jgi:transposase-like protein
VHRNAPLTPEGRLRLCRLIEEGWTVAAAAESFRISRQTAHKWWRRYQEAGDAGLIDRSSRPRCCPTKTPIKVERRVVELRRRHQVSAARLADRAGSPPQPCTQSGHATAFPGSLTSNATLGGSSVALRRATQASSSTSTSRNRPRSLQEEAGGFMDGDRLQIRIVGTEIVSATPTSTPPSTPTRAWPIRTSIPTSRP